MAKTRWTIDPLAPLYAILYTAITLGAGLTAAWVAHKHVIERRQGGRDRKREAKGVEFDGLHYACYRAHPLGTAVYWWWIGVLLMIQLFIGATVVTFYNSSSDRYLTHHFWSSSELTGSEGRHTAGAGTWSPTDSRHGQSGHRRAYDDDDEQPWRPAAEKNLVANPFLWFANNALNLRFCNRSSVRANVDDCATVGVTSDAERFANMGYIFLSLGVAGLLMALVFLVWRRLHFWRFCLQRVPLEAAKAAHEAGELSTVDYRKMSKTVEHVAVSQTVGWDDVGEQVAAPSDHKKMLSLTPKGKGQLQKREAPKRAPVRELDDILPVHELHLGAEKSLRYFTFRCARHILYADEPTAAALSSRDLQLDVTPRQLTRTYLGGHHADVGTKVRPAMTQ